MSTTAKVREFVDAYRMAFEAFDAAAIADLFFHPCQITSDAEKVTVMTVPTRDLWSPAFGSKSGPLATARHWTA